MEAHDILKENENYRVGLMYQEYADKPDWDGQTPVLARYYRGHSYRFEAVNEEGNEFESILTELFARFGWAKAEDIITRFLKIFYGAYSVEWDSSQEAQYVSFDTAEWRERHGLTDEHLDRHAEDLDREKLAEGTLSEWISWANGEVYGYVIEKKFATSTTFTDPLTGAEYTEEDEEWVEVEDGSLWGLYGYAYAKQEAEEAFDAEVKRAEES
jgi:hypothetical protein